MRHQFRKIFRFHDILIHNIHRKIGSVSGNNRQKNRNYQRKNKPRSEFHPNYEKPFQNTTRALFFHWRKVTQRIKLSQLTESIFSLKKKQITS